MLGLGFVAGGIRRMEASYNNDLASIFGSLLTLSVAGLVLPTASQLLATPVEGGIVKQSRSIAIVFIIIYMGLLFYQLKSHESMFASVEDPDDDREIEERDNEILGTSSAVAVIAASTVFVGFNTYFAVNSLEGLLDTTNLDLCLQTTVGKCIQTTMFVIPLVVIIGWGMKIDEMTLFFNGFDVTALFASALYITFLTNNGKSN
jgi:Ca2+:H+ antiporter